MSVSRSLIRFTLVSVARTYHYWYYVFLIEPQQKIHNVWFFLVVIRLIAGSRWPLIYHFKFPNNLSSNCFSSHWWLLHRSIVLLGLQKGYTLILSSHLYLYYLEFIHNNILKYRKPFVWIRQLFDFLSSFCFHLFVGLVTQLCPSLCDSMAYSPPGSSVHGISQARILEWVATSFNLSCYNFEEIIKPSS